MTLSISETFFWMVSKHALNQQMSRSGPESGGLVLRVDQKKWPGFKTDKQKQKKKKKKR